MVELESIVASLAVSASAHVGLQWRSYLYSIKRPIGKQQRSSNGRWMIDQSW